MLGRHVAAGAVSNPVLEPTIDCCAIDRDLRTISCKVCPERRIPGHGMHAPVRIQSRRVDDEHWGMRFPVRLEHLPTSRNHALPSLFNLDGSFGIGAHQMRAANKARCKTTSREAVESWVTPPDEDAIGRACSFNDPLDDREKIGRLLTQSERHD